ncbi:MAG: mgtE [Rickettsiaceae bacterium]|jgi:magnesium transporter|nr:mgtE [Rickettsiaceae bacterium]
MLETHSRDFVTPDHHAEITSKFEQLDIFLENEDLASAKEVLKSFHYADFTDFLEKSSIEKRKTIIHILGEELKPEALVWLDPHIKSSVINTLGVKQVASLIDKLDIEDAIEVVEDLSSHTKEKILEYLPEAKQAEINEGFTYPENCAGRIMEKNFISFAEHWTVGQAIDSIRRQKNNTKDFYAAIVTDTKERPVGNILLSTLLKHSRSTPIRELMNEEFKVSDTHTDTDELSYLFRHYALTIIPVVNRKGKLVGTISLDNMVYIIEEQAEEDIMHLAGVTGTDIYSRLHDSVKQRFPWLFVNLITAFFTSAVISMFEPTIAHMVALASVMPIVASMGGNAGTQTVTVAVRSIANKDLTSHNSFRVILKELLTCGFNGLILGILGAIVVFILYKDFELSFIFAVAVLFTFCAAGFFGSAIPIFFNKLKIDPAVASSVFLTALTDCIGFFTFLALAKVFIIG